MITIDGKNIKTKWGLEPKYDKFYTPLLKAAKLKKKITNDWSDMDGLDVQPSPNYTEASICNITFICSNMTMLRGFEEYLYSHPTILLYDSNLGEYFNLEYMDCFNFKFYKEFIIFGIKVRLGAVESNIYLTTSNSEPILTSNNESIVVF